MTEGDDEKITPERLFAVPGKTDLEITALFAWVVTQPDGGEGIAGITLDGPGESGVSMPLIGADVDRIQSYRWHAQWLRKATGYPVRLVRFSSREDLEVLP